jgi:hypothetical protein
MTMKGHAFYIVLGIAAIYACGEQDTPTRPTALIGGAGGEAGEPAGGASPEAAAGGPPSAQAGDSTAGGMSTLQGGAPSSAGAGQGPTNDAGMPPVPGGGAGGMPGGDLGVEQLALCGRLNQRAVLSSRFVSNFDFVVYWDACIGWTTKLYEVEQAQGDYLNQLSAWNQRFWGCTEMGAEGFALLWKQPDVLTAGDANRLIARYISVLNAELEALGQSTLSPNEEMEMRAALERLSKSMVTDPTLDYSHPECLNPPVGEGGAGGEGGGGGGAGGEGGQVALGGAGQGGL